MIQNGYLIPDTKDRCYYAIKDGSLYHIKEQPKLKDLAPGYYDDNLNPVPEDEALGA